MNRRQKQPIKHRTPLTHEAAARTHCWRRAWQRFGLALSISDIRDLEHQIVSGRAEWIMDQKALRTVYWVRRDEKRMIGVFDIKLWALVTILPGLGFLKGISDER